MYLSYFGLRRPPFRITPDPDFFFPGGNRGAVLEALTYAVTEGEGIVKVVGEVGSGKTMLLRMLARELPKDCTLAYLPNPSLSPDEMVRALAFELGIEATDSMSKTTLMLRLNDYLVEQHGRGRRVVVFVEEAQGMPLETLEEIRLLSNLETSRDKLLQIVLFGQPELDDKIRSHAMRQLAERITYGFDLPPLTVREIGDYLNARLRASGYRGNGLFTPGAVRRITRHSHGLLRRINILADKALLAAFADSDREVTAKHVRKAASDSKFGPLTPRRRPWLRFSFAALFLLAAVPLFLVVDPGRRGPPPEPFASTSAPVPPDPAESEVTVGLGHTPRPAGDAGWTVRDARLVGTSGDASAAHTDVAPAGFGRLEAVAPTLGGEVTVDSLVGSRMLNVSGDIVAEP